MSILTNYRPNFCCQCGHKIVRLHWRIWTSRRFCDKCVRGFAKANWLRPSLTLLALLVFGVLVGRGCRRAPQPLLIERTASLQKPTTTTASTTTSAPEPFPPVDDVYICGARTKKGTPCSRRVHGPVRCWQHKGARAMLPPEKLLVKE